MGWVTGLEPATTGLENRCSIRLSYGRIKTVVLLVKVKLAGRGREIRTPDPLLPKQMRYQAALCPADARFFTTYIQHKLNIARDAIIRALYMAIKRLPQVY